MDVKMIIIYGMCLIGIMIIGKIFIVPIKIIVKVLINSILGIALLYVINMIGVNWGLHIGINIVTALTVGILGIPGAALLAVIKMFMLWIVIKEK